MPDGDGPKLVQMPPTPAPAQDFPVVALRELLARVEAGELNPQHIVIFLVEPNADGTWRPQTWRANTPLHIALAMSALLTDNLVREIKGDK